MATLAVFSRSVRIGLAVGLIYTAEPRFEKASWTIPSDVLEAVRRHASRGKVSAYVAEALRRQLEVNDLAALVVEMEETSGPFDPEVVARYVDEMR